MKIQIWANLGVKNLERTEEFYTKLGFKKTPGQKSDELTSFLFGDDDFVIHFFKDENLKKAMKSDLSDLSKGNEVIFSISAETEAEVNDWAVKVKDAGGNVFSPPEGFQGMYGCAFTDPDGHKFNILKWK
ncbi:VOC family protein [Pedobacter punctiformis]|uniref:VOC family protein n=1 Tax=Pedobacter punctiformis TaxID=3004097 RepID=A0ABT4L768_9SPHI|nr:VOC family protein [Pedobacter sp. HCMS5-2]MCZ4243762.1 VOC family protein [Pedobacter sp. HCMS5-2]